MIDPTLRVQPVARWVILGACLQALACDSSPDSGPPPTFTVNAPVGAGVPTAGAAPVENVATSGSGGTATASGSGGSSVAGGAGAATMAGSSGTPMTAGASGTPALPVPTERFSFFVTSYAAMQRLSGTQAGFGGDLRYGEADGLAGADKICTEIAEASMPGAGGKGWRAFLSVTRGPSGGPVHAIDRIGSGPWYDRLGRLVAMTKQDLLTTRPTGADPAIVDDLPNEDGVPNHQPDPNQEEVDNHDFLTGSDLQ